MEPISNKLTKADLKQIFKKYYKTLVLFANRFLNSRDECQDLVQDIFVGLWENKNTFPNETSLKVYLYKTTRNKCYNIIKHNKVKDHYVATTRKALEDDNLFLKQVLEEEVVRQLYKVIEALPTRKQEIIKLSLKGLKNNEIAETLDIKLQTVKTLKSQSYKILREQFKEHEAIIYFLLT